MTSTLTPVFISWSGDRSLKLATALNGWLKMVIQTIDPWFSGRDIPSGERWDRLLGESLQRSSVGVFCITRENLNSPWLLFEAGAVSKSLTRGRMIPLLLDLTRAELRDPLAQFQALECSKDGIRRLVEDLHTLTDSKVSKEQQASLFEALWPILEKDLTPLKSMEENRIATKMTTPSPDDILREILDEVRGLRVAPDEASIASALTQLENQAHGELLLLKERVSIPSNTGSEDRALTSAVEEASDRLLRIKASKNSLKRGPSSGVKASAIRIVNFSDLYQAIKLFISDIEYREYQMELRGDTDNPYYHDISDQWTILKKVDDLLKELDVNLPGIPES
jgi:hypothetical protein